MSDSTSAQSNIRYKHERARLESYVGYPHSNVDVKKFASAGFFYTGKSDVVRCAFCNIDLERWREGDDPFQDHKRWASQCKFVNGLDVGNVPMDPDDPLLIATPDKSRGVDECGIYGITPCNLADDLSLERLGICRRYTPAHPSYATLESRLQTYQCWPVGLKLRPQALSEAGFYYTGLGDRTICFQCGGGLKDWSDNDDPWLEHALYFSKCTYLLQKKGRDFVDQVIGKKQSQELLSVATSTEDGKPPLDRSASDVADESLIVRSNSNMSSSSSGYGSGGSYQEEQEDQTKEKKVDDQRACKICYEEEMGVVFLPCGHMVACVNCAPSLQLCAICRKPFTATVRAYLS